MDIKSAKEQIKNAITAYFTKNEYGEYVIPIERQRPVFLMGPPGIGKTAIMEQIASELGVGLVSYSMTHHTRQSALGLPFIQKKVYGGKEYSVSEYTMSEIIASMYDMMEETGLKEGMLFLDEINCVSETLAPSMLQFLQYKVFGRHKVPEGWIVVTAGNPPEYNDSVREFDIVTWDRMKRIDVTPDYKVWKEYASDNGVHPSVTTYLDIKSDDFYRIETTVDGKNIVTPRGWSDLSEMITLYEQNKIKVDERLVSQYIQDKKTAKSFSIYYDLFNKYKSDYQIEDILEGKASTEVKERAKAAKFDERLSLIGLILDSLNTDFKQVYLHEMVLTELMVIFKKVKAELNTSPDVAKKIDKAIKERNTELNNGKRSGALSNNRSKILHGTIEALEEEKALLANVSETGTIQFEIIRDDFNQRKGVLKQVADKTHYELTSALKFADEVFNDGQEMVIIIAELTKGQYSANYISRYGNQEYFKHNKSLLFHERQVEVIREIEELGL